MTTLIIFALLIGFILLGIPVAVAMGLTAVLTFLAMGQADILTMTAQRMYASTTSFTLLAMPLFIFMGAMFATWTEGGTEPWSAWSRDAGANWSEARPTADRLRLLTKSLRPLPEKHKGLTDTEARYRHRYVDLMVNEDSRRVFHARSKIISAMRQYFTDR